jgi:ectoine hydroxylase-related dioxygenase (phytanoyl-CoA dioxygenase family)
MQVYDVANADPQQIVDDLLNKDGAVLIRGLFSAEQITQARSIVMEHSDRQVEKTTHFQGVAAEDGKLDLQRRVWNLLAKGEVFSRMASHPTIMSILRLFLGDGFIMGSIAANRILPNGPGQEPHIDYPYWDYYNKSSHPYGLNSSFPLNAQVSILLDPFTEQNGATAFVAGSQKELRYPTAADDFHHKAQRMLGEAGDIVLFFGAIWHCAMPNYSHADRSAVLVQYLPKWVKPMENMPAVLSSQFIEHSSNEIKQLLGLDYPYPENLDASKAGNTEGAQ